LLQNCRYLFVLSWLWPLVAPEELELDGVGELELDWPLEAPEPAEPLPDMEPELEELGLDEAPPPALFFSSVDEEAAPELELGEVGDWELEDDAAPEGEDGVVAAPEGDEVEPEDDAAPEPPVVRPAEPVSLSPQAARPNARVTAAASIESFMCLPPWLGYGEGSKLRTRLGALVAVLLGAGIVLRVGMVVGVARVGLRLRRLRALRRGQLLGRGAAARGGARRRLGWIRRDARLGRLVAAGGHEGRSEHGGEYGGYTGSHGHRSLLLVAGYLYLQGMGREDLSPGGHGDIHVT
jgi:hypothetical protein